MLALLFPPARAPADDQTPGTLRATTPFRIWYAHHSGWFVETPLHVLAFDYIGTGWDDTVSALKDRLLTSCASGGRRLVVFVSHEHADHYSKAIFKWQKRVSRVTYVLGLTIGAAVNRVQLEARADTLVDGLRIRTIRSTDAGVGFLVNVDGLIVFHAGDHALWDASDQTAYSREIDWLAALGEGIDIAFLPVATGGACETTRNLQAGASYALLKLQPAVAFPMHVRCTEQIGLYRQVAERLRSSAGRGTLLYAERPGEGFEYEQRSRKVARLKEPLDSEPPYE